MQNESKDFNFFSRFYQLIDKENHLDSDNIINEKIYNFEVGEQDTHPVDNPLAK